MGSLAQKYTVNIMSFVRVELKVHSDPCCMFLNTNLSLY